MMSESVMWISAGVLAGLAAGTLFFALLWLTVWHITSSSEPGSMVVASFLTRTLIVLATFYATLQLHVAAALAFIPGFLFARWLIVTQAAKFDSARRTVP